MIVPALSSLPDVSFRIGPVNVVHAAPALSAEMALPPVAAVTVTALEEATKPTTKADTSRPTKNDFLKMPLL